MMSNSLFKNLLLIGLTLSTIVLFGQEKEPSPFDYGRMWTFENPPKEWFKEAYDFAPEDEWFDFVRKSSLRFASWCSASFVSPDGLIMTNHHCSRDEGISIQETGENFDENGFYATTLADERRVPDLYVEQMIKAVDVTDDVNTAIKSFMGDNMEEKRTKAMKQVEDLYASKEGWEGLRLQTVSFYSGVKYSIYGYKRFDDIRLVCMPENSIGFYGGDPDNFTYPRYNLDFTFWRAYDESGNPLNTTDNYLKFNPAGAEEGEAVFVVGNPGRTERYRTASQLAYDRDHRYNGTLEMLTNRINLMQEEYAEIKDVPEKQQEAQELLGRITNFANGQKAYRGILGGLRNPDLYGRKVAMENLIKEKSGNTESWDKIDEMYKELTPHAWAVNNLGPSPIKGNILSLMHELHGLESMIKAEAPADEITAKKDAIKEMASTAGTMKEKKLFTVLLSELSKAIPSDNMALSSLMGNKSISSYVDMIFNGSQILANDDLAKLFKKDKKLLKSDDPLLKAARTLVPRYQTAVEKYQLLSPQIKVLETDVVNKAFDVFGDALPPDATFTLRISDGIVKNYEYNGTVAPYKTTFFGLYDRHYSHGEKYPWNLPEKWLNPSMELLMSPVNIVSTNDIIGGNSGSPMINKNREAVGLIFDGNIESLPGNFIFDEESNRTVSVHAGGIHAALKYVYKADRLVEELEGK